jgi:hypothetical protein
MSISRSNPLYSVLKSQHHRFEADKLAGLFRQVSEQRVQTLATRLADYIEPNLLAALQRRSGLADYRTNPYVLMTSASVLSLDDPSAFGVFLFNSKLYMTLETSFGKSIEAAFLEQYPLGPVQHKWIEPPEKLAEFAELGGLSREAKARKRVESVWREIDRSCVVGDRRYLTSIKSGPNTINDTQVQAMTRAVVDNHEVWLYQSRHNYPQVSGIDIVLGLTYGTDRTTNNKENQWLAKLLDFGFEEEDRRHAPGVLIDSATKSIRVYRHIGQDFWAFIGRPNNPEEGRFMFLEVLLALAKALAQGTEMANLEARINAKIGQLISALAKLTFPKASLPDWVREDFTEDELFWFATAMTAFYDEGI